MRRIIDLYFWAMAGEPEKNVETSAGESSDMVES